MKLATVSSFVVQSRLATNWASTQYFTLRTHRDGDGSDLSAKYAERDDDTPIAFLSYSPVPCSSVPQPFYQSSVLFSMILLSSIHVLER